MDELYITRMMFVNMFHFVTKFTEKNLKKVEDDGIMNSRI